MACERNWCSNQLPRPLCIPNELSRQDSRPRRKEESKATPLPYATSQVAIFALRSAHPAGLWCPQQGLAATAKAIQTPTRPEHLCILSYAIVIVNERKWTWKEPCSSRNGNDEAGLDFKTLLLVRVQGDLGEQTQNKQYRPIAKQTCRNETRVVVI